MSSMGKTLFLTFVIWFSIHTVTPDSIAQEISDWHLRHLPEGTIARIGKGAITGNIAYSNDGTRLAVAASIGIWIYDAHTHEAQMLITGHTEIVRSVDFSPDDAKLVSSSSDKTIRLWDTHTGAHLRTLRGHTDDVNNVAFSPDSTTIVSSSCDGTFRLWYVQTGD